MDICIDCDGDGKYPSGADCISCGGCGRVLKGDGIPYVPKPGVEIISRRSTQIGGVKVNFTVGRIGKSDR